MKATLIIDDALVARVRMLSGIKDTAALVRAALEALIARDAGNRLAALGGKEPKITSVQRRRLG